MRNPDEENKVPFRTLLDPLTAERLLVLADELQIEPSLVIASMVHDVLDDEARSNEAENVVHLTTLQ